MFIILLLGRGFESQILSDWGDYTDFFDWKNGPVKNLS
jgi:hypothetical protein